MADYQLQSDEPEFLGSPENYTEAGRTTLRSIVAGIFRAEFRGPANQARTTDATAAERFELRPSVELIRAGRSSARKYRIDFQRTDGSRRAYRYIARVHHGENADDNARAEAEAARNLTRQLPGYFPRLVHLDGNEPVIVYRFTDDERNQPMADIASMVLELTTAESVAAVTGFVERLERFLVAITGAFDSSADTRNTDAASYFQQVVRELPPDLIVTTTAELDFGMQHITAPGFAEAMVVLPREHFPRANKVDTVGPDQLVERLAEAGPTWLHARLKCQRLRSYERRAGTLAIMGDGNLELWLSLRPGQPESFRVERDADLSILIAPRDHPGLVESSEVLARQQYTSAGILGRPAFRERIEAVARRLEVLELHQRHADLHSGNAMGSVNGEVLGEDLKIIDLGDIRHDLRLTDFARLEFSLWHEYADVLGLATDATRGLLARLENPDDWPTAPRPAAEPATEDGKADPRPPLALDDYKVWAFGSVLAAIRRAARTAYLADPVDPAEEALTYALQCLYYQRYDLFTGGEAVPHGARAVVEYWFNRLRAVDDMPDPKEDEGPEPEQHESDFTLFDLWTHALHERGRYGDSYAPTDRMQSFLEHLRTRHPERVENHLTAFQDVVRGLCDGTRSDPFTGDGHLILAGPTSCGKTTVAEMLLIQAALSEDPRGALYIAPQRALAQQKFRELQRLLQDFEVNSAGESRWRDQIYVSTGEDTSGDWRIAHGRFKIACMVYEKANILFSRNKNFLDRVSLIVVDEFHMVSDQERGPLLELALTKAARIGKKRESDEERYPRIVAISTEGADYSDVQQFLAIGPDSAVRPARVIHSDRRPVPVRHLLVLPDRKATSSRIIEIVRFTSTGERVLSKKLREQKLHEIAGSVGDPEFHRELTTDSMETRLEALIDKQTYDHGRAGYRVLVFVPSKAQAEQLARNLRDRRNNYHQKAKKRRAEIRQRLHMNTQPIPNHVRKIYDGYAKRIRDVAINSDEDAYIEGTLVGCARLGVFFHHADISKEVRSEIERIATEPPGPREAHVIFATETLKYGVNLAVNDVILYGYEFYRSSRDEDIARRSPLDLCSYHNMVGRAGRLGKIRRRTAYQVFVLVPSQRSAFHDVVESYYTSIRPALSVLYVEADRRAITRQKEHEFLGESSKIGASNFSPPFVTAVLDALRHLNLQAGTSYSRDHVVGCNRGELLRFLGIETLFAYQNLPRYGLEPDHLPLRKKTLEFFKDSVDFVLQDCASDTLGLVEMETKSDGQNFVKITPRGEAVIDTGTEVATIQPMLDLALRLHALWQAHRRECPGLAETAPVPTEVFLLCVIAQRELYREYLRKMPEMADTQHRTWPEESASVNRQDVLKNLVESLETIGVAQADAFGQKLRRLLEGWDAFRDSEITEKYRHGQVDSTLRMLDALFRWIHGDPFGKVKERLEQTRVDDASQRDRFTSFRSFKDQVGWKTRFLAIMLETNGRPLDIDERHLAQLEARVRIGCQLDAIPLNYRDSGLSRPEGNGLVRCGYPASVILAEVMSEAPAQPSDIPAITREKWTKLRQELERFAVDKSAELLEVWTARGAPDGDDDASHLIKLWNEVFPRRFRSAVENFRSRDQPPVGFDRTLVEGLENFENPLWVSGTDDLVPIESSRRRGSPRVAGDEEITVESSRVVIRVPDHDPGFYWDFEDQVGRDRPVEAVSIRFVGVEFQHDGQVSHDGQTWMTPDRLFAALGSARHLAIVALPWLPRRRDAFHQALAAYQQRTQASIKILSPAAFLVVSTMLKRGFVNSGVVREGLIRATPGARPEYLTCHDLIPLTRSSLARVNTLRDSLLTHFEVVDLPTT